MVAGLAAAAAYAGLLATTRPFTPAANLLTALGLLVGLGALVARLVAGPTPGSAPGGTHGSVPGGWPGTAPGGAPGGRPAPPTARERAGGSWIPWAALVAALVGWELFCYFAGARVAHPTLSSLYDLAARHTWVKALVAVAWLGIGWELVRP